MDPVLTIFVDPAWRRDAAHTPLLNPFWGGTSHKNSPFADEALSMYLFDVSHYRITDDISIADVVLFPFRYHVAHIHFADLLATAIDTARAHGKHIIIDAMGDIDYDISIPETIVLKYGGYRFAKKENEIFLPPFADDLLERYCDGKLSVRAKSKKPVVGFAGWLEAPFFRRIYWGAKDLPARLRGMVDGRYRADRKGIFFRRAAKRALDGSPAVATNILARTAYSGNVKTAAGNIETLRKEFVENALTSDLCLDIRGDANNSTRLFEILSLGRVPLIIDTERNFPFSDELDYRSFAITVDFRDIRKLPEIARAAYDAISDDVWRDMQVKARAAYVAWFRMDALTAHLIRSIRARLA